MSEVVDIDFSYSGISKGDLKELWVSTVGCGCCGDAFELTDEILQEIIEETRKNLDELIKLRDKKKDKQ